VSDQAAQLFEAGRYEEALTAFRLSVADHRLDADPDLELYLAAELNNVGMCLGKLRQFDAAVEPFREATDIYARHWRDDDRLSPFYAAAMASLAGVLTELGRYDEALDMTNVVVFLRRAGITPGPLTIDPDLAKALRQFAHTRALAGRDLDRALPAASEAVTIYQHLATANPQDYLREWYLAGRILADVLDGAGRPTDAAQVRSWLTAQQSKSPT
jgi:tetratricopeptide (TPR) repeat protein